MKLKIVFISGPAGAGKSTLVRLIAGEVCDQPPHYVRLVAVDCPGGPRPTLLGDLKTARLESWRRVNYDAERIFEFLPEALQEIASTGRSRTVLLEADADPNLRYAYPYDHRIFIMPAPAKVEQIFRTPAQAAVALKEVMDDTAAFASEIFGLFDPESDDEPVCQRVRDRHGGTEERIEITAEQMRRFMNTSLGAEVASRIQLQPAYHGLMESDIIVLNTAIGGVSDVVDRCSRQIQTLVNRLGEGRRNRPVLFTCDPIDPSDPLREQFLQRLKLIL